MSFLGDLADRGVKELGDRAPGWIEDGLKEAAKLLPKGDTVEERALREGGEYALAKLEAHKSSLGRMSYQTALAFLGHTAIGQYSEASSVLLSAYGGGQGAWGAADAVVAGAGDATEQAKHDQDELKALAKTIGSTAAKAALPLLMAMA